MRDDRGPKTLPEETEFLAYARTGLGPTVDYLLRMERLFDSDTRAFLALTRGAVDSLLEERENASRFAQQQLLARSLIRASFAHIEGVAYLMREAVLWAHDRGEIPLLPSELSLLSEGVRGGKRRFNSFQRNVELAFEYFPKAYGADFALDTVDPRWESFQHAIRVRDAITHPKVASEFGVSGDALRDAQLALYWFSDNFRRLLAACSDDAVRRH